MSRISHRPCRPQQPGARRTPRIARRMHPSGGLWGFLDHQLGDRRRFRRLLVLVSLTTIIAAQPSAVPTITTTVSYPLSVRPDDSVDAPRGLERPAAPGLSR